MKGFLDVGAAVITAAIYTQSIKGTVFSSNFVGLTAQNVNPSFIVDQHSYLTPFGTQDTECSATGGLATYDTCYIPSPFRSGAASSRGLKAGSGVVTYVQLDVIANPNGYGIDCTRVGGANEGTGGTLIFNNVSATGSINIYSTPFTMGPTEAIKCGSLGGGAGIDLRLKGIVVDSDVTN